MCLLKKKLHSTHKRHIDNLLMTHAMDIMNLQVNKTIY